jgi:hypothetical protein
MSPFPTLDITSVTASLTMVVTEDIFVKVGELGVCLLVEFLIPFFFQKVKSQFFFKNKLNLVF